MESGPDRKGKEVSALDVVYSHKDDTRIFEGRFRLSLQHLPQMGAELDKFKELFMEQVNKYLAKEIKDLDKYNEDLKYKVRDLEMKGVPKKL